MIEGPPGSGKSSLALALIDRGAILVGDDAVGLARRGECVWALPPPNIAGLLEIAGVGIVTLPTCEAPLSLVLALGAPFERLPEPETARFEGVDIPRLAVARAGRPELLAEWALRIHGLPLPGPCDN